ncbi:ribokinase [Methylobacterium haplocladii]|uniref:Ribokinase n=1 Tax=Methylobacterium haplocladii TaxID=1176176 RepID=A0A512IRG8_9HYPH|nr:ribokinase [Methylobacterium haplocladii]GEP00302.1 ribokinase [Methylobacterium haplocladii]GJD86073.1 Bifunctional ribokinase/ribose-5-phosphate isomerase A [Methylobacterium haplocladii]GLS59792.1 ribokinase [Methylobacterium haplocladii]
MQIFVVGSFVVACSVKVARLPRAGESLDAQDFVSEPGGKGFNLALAAHRLGASIEGVFAIGDDPFAAVAVSAFEGAGLATDMLVTRSGSTGAGVGFVDQAGENCLAVNLGANRLLGAGDVDRARIARADFVMATFESPDAPIAEAFAQARSRGIRTLLNPSPSRPIDPRILADTAILVVNRVEAADLGLDVADAGTAQALLRAGPAIVVVTLGEEGAVVFQRDETACRQAAFPVAVIDTIGAGDAFSAGFAVGLLEGRPVGEALVRAAACGAITACRFGAFDAFPTKAELDRFCDAAAG